MTHYVFLDMKGYVLSEREREREKKRAKESEREKVEGVSGTIEKVS
jgi:hypothetical protein